MGSPNPKARVEGRTTCSILSDWVPECVYLSTGKKLLTCAEMSIKFRFHLHITQYNSTSNHPYEAILPCCLNFQVANDISIASPKQ